MSKVGGGRNFGYGKRLDWAAKNALHDRYGSGHYSTRASHEARWQPFVQFLKAECQIKDARHIDQSVVMQYAQYLQTQVQSQHMKVAYAQNLLSTINIVLSTMRKDNLMQVSPSALVGNRTNVREHQPATLNTSTLNQPIKTLLIKGENNIACVAGLCRTLGLRFKEASMLNSQTALRQANRYQRINITEGTKGGRGKQVDRWVPVTPEAITALEKAAQVQGHCKNLIPTQSNYIQWRNHAYNQWTLATADSSIHGFHDLRAGYACDRYSTITNGAPPLLNRYRSVDKQLDKKARAIIAKELGHNRIDILVSYIGSAK